MDICFKRTGSFDQKGTDRALEETMGNMEDIQSTSGPGRIWKKKMSAFRELFSKRIFDFIWHKR